MKCVEIGLLLMVAMGWSPGIYAEKLPIFKLAAYLGLPDTSTVLVISRARELSPALDRCSKVRFNAYVQGRSKPRIGLRA